jgi:hypothetical protein
VDAAIQALLTISLFAAVHERAIEFVRHVADHLPPSADPPPTSVRAFTNWLRWAVDSLTIGPAAIIPAIGVAVATHANLLALFQFDSGKNTSKYYELYLEYGPGSGFLEQRDVMGCVLMGLAAALGSRFWHDLAYGLVDLRTQAKAAARNTALAAAPSIPPKSAATPSPAMPPTG